MWGSDYPHIESTWQYTDDDAAVPVTHLALRNTFHAIPPRETAAMLGENAIRVFGLDRDALTAVAARIGAPTLANLSVPIDAVPAGASPGRVPQLRSWS